MQISLRLSAYIEYHKLSNIINLLKISTYFAFWKKKPKFKEFLLSICLI